LISTIGLDRLELLIARAYDFKPLEVQGGKQMKIGKFAKSAGTKASTVRYYEQLGLLPAPRRISGNQRRYGETDMARLGFILRCRALGFSLEQIRQFARIAQTGGGATDQCQKIVHARLMSVRARIKEMKSVEQRLAGLLADQAAPSSATARPCTKLAVLA
jgi:DNA-binding transcriptional MerR regulator